MEKQKSAVVMLSDFGIDFWFGCMYAWYVQNGRQTVENI